MSNFNFLFFLISFGAIFCSQTLNASNNISGDCLRIVSASQDPTPAQITGGNLPAITSEISWQQPARAVYKGNFSGVNGSAASHEGVDYVHNDQSVTEVEIRAAADGKVVYVREGCDQSSMFAHNNTGRESGAGWGNHIVLSHKSAVYTRYGHLLKNSVLVNVGDSVKAGQIIATMGNSGRSETRHLHFELGTKTTVFNACEMSQNFDRVYNSELLNFQNTPLGLKTVSPSIISIAPNPIINEFTLFSNRLIGNRTSVSILDFTGKQLDCLLETGRTTNTRSYKLSKMINSGIHLLIITENDTQSVLKINIAQN